MATDATFIDEASAVVRKLLQAHEREIIARLADDAAAGPPRLSTAYLLRGLEPREPETEALFAATAVTDAAITELVMTLDDRMQDHIVWLVQRTGLSLQEPTVS